MRRIRISHVAIGCFLLIAGIAGAQSRQAQTQPVGAPELVVQAQLVRQAQQVHIPVNVFHADTSPAGSLTTSDFQLSVDGKPQTFQLARSGENLASNSAPDSTPGNNQAGHAASHLNLLLLLPNSRIGRRKAVLKQAIRYFNGISSLHDWNVSIFDDSGHQSAYTSNIVQLRKDLHAVEKLDPDNFADNPVSWRDNAIFSIENMRQLPGRRVAIALGDVFHQAAMDEDSHIFSAFDAVGVADAGRFSGAVVYASENFKKGIPADELAPRNHVAGTGPWILLNRQNRVEGWMTTSFLKAVQMVQQTQSASYDLQITLTPQQMDGRPHRISVRLLDSKLLWSAPPFFVAPDLSQIKILASAPEYLRNALHSPISSSSLNIVPRLDYFPQASKSEGTQVVSLSFYWNKPTPPPRQLQLLGEVTNTNFGYKQSVFRDTVPWNQSNSVWKLMVTVIPGSYILRVAAADNSGKIVTSEAYPFTVDPIHGEQVLISSLVVGKTCRFVPPVAPGQQKAAAPINVLQAGHCLVEPDPIGDFSPQEVVWTLVRMTPTGRFKSNPTSVWVGSLTIRNANGKFEAEQPVHWMNGGNGSYVASAAFPLASDKLKDGKYAVVLELRGPGLGDEFEEVSPFIVYGAYRHAKAGKPQK
ncbi:MAG TPA: hypothetical protein VHX63_03975 [Acidobacteriaceae bacterium]|nr:hypothetical protein [Acidobacteriaceae bacterium]